MDARDFFSVSRHFGLGVRKLKYAYVCCGGFPFVSVPAAWDEREREGEEGLRKGVL
jgi:hypothetical protein